MSAQGSIQFKENVQSAVSGQKTGPDQTTDLDMTFGHVGIGTTNPGSDVSMAGGLTINGTGITQLTVMASGTSSFALNASAGGWTMFDKASGGWSSSITSKSGNVGIGTTAPGYGLDVNSLGAAFGTGTGAATVYLRDVANASWALGTGGYQLGFYNNNGGSYVSKMVITNAGNVGIGTTTPAERLDLGGGNIKMGYTTNGNSHITLATSQAAQSWSGYVTVCGGNGFVISASCWASYPYTTCPWSVNSSGQLAAFNCNASGAATLACNVICANIR